MQETQETRGSIPGSGDPLEEGTATHSTLLAWRIPTDRGAWWATLYRVTKSRPWLRGLSVHTRTHAQHGRNCGLLAHGQGARVCPALLAASWPHPSQLWPPSRWSLMQGQTSQAVVLSRCWWHCRASWPGPADPGLWPGPAGLAIRSWPPAALQPAGHWASGSACSLLPATQGWAGRGAPLTLPFSLPRVCGV